MGSNGWVLIVDNTFCIVCPWPDESFRKMSPMYRVMHYDQSAQIKGESRVKNPRSRTSCLHSVALPNITCDKFHSRKWSKLASNKKKGTFVKSPMPAFAHQIMLEELCPMYTFLETSVACAIGSSVNPLQNRETPTCEHCFAMLCIEFLNSQI